MNKVNNENKGKEFVPKMPDYKGDGVAIWKRTDKNGKEYMRVKVLGGAGINCFEPNNIRPKN